MPCHHPLPAWRGINGEITLAKEPKASTATLALPCGGCLGCRLAAARGWALRCQLELQQHDAAVVTTLTYDHKHQPTTLTKTHVAAFLKRLRQQKPAQPIRFFACGEYGEQKGRPHYHAILYGLHHTDHQRIQDAWTTGRPHNEPLGTVRHTQNVSPAAIAYVAGYTAKKIGFKLKIREQVDPETGEVYTWQPPFIQMSRRPGIGGQARKWVASWRSYAIHNGTKQAVPRFLHEAWKKQATNEELEQLLYEKEALTRHYTQKQLEDAEKNAIARQRLAGQKRQLN